MSNQFVTASTLTTESSAASVLQRKCNCGNQASSVTGECDECQTKKGLGLQAKLSIGTSDDPLEREADRVADQVIRASGSAEIGHSPPRIQRFSGQSNGQGSIAPASVDRALAGTGKPMGRKLRREMEQHFGHDFSKVRLHTDSLAEQSANEINARAYTVGQKIVFGKGEFASHKSEGRRLIAHELTHVVQQSSVSTNPTLRRANPDAVNRTMSLSSVVGSGVQFFPTNIVDTVVGPVSVRGGLLSSRASRLNVIVAENLTPRLLARQILPLWTTATPFTPPGGAASVPLTAIDDETLAKGLLVYNQYYLPVPAMRRWQAGLNFPLPVEIDETTGIATLHPDLIVNLASAFDAAWTPLLDARVQATAAPAPADLARDVTNFLAREPSAQARGIFLGARAQTNPTAELPFFREIFSQLGADDFEVALNFMDFMVNREISLLAAQADGAAILAIIGNGLAPPASITPDQQRRLDRANHMLGLVAGVAAQPAPAAMTARPEKTITVDTLKLQGSSRSPSTDISVANAVYSQCNIRVVPGVSADDNNSTPPQTTTWLGGNTDLRGSNNCLGPSTEERALFSTASAAHGMASGAGRFSAFYVASISGVAASAYTCPTRFGAHGLARHKIIVSNTASTDTIAHELGHHLITGGHPAGGIMAPRPRPTEITGPQCALAYSRA